MYCRTVIRVTRSVAQQVSVCRQQARNLSLHEHHSQNLLKQYSIPVARGEVAETAEDVSRIIQELNVPCVIKSQILAGGRGKGSFDSGLQGGIQSVSDPQKGFKLAQQMLGHRLKTKQTTEQGRPVSRVYVVEQVKYAQEYYLAMTIDRTNYCPALIISQAGGVDIETTSKENPELLHQIRFTLKHGITSDLVSEVQSKLKCSDAEAATLEPILRNMFKLFVEKDAGLLEINPLVRTETGEFICLDAKFNFDNAAQHRQADLFALRDRSEELPDELEAEQYGLVYVRLDGNIGNVVNGAGLAMATNDAIAHYGGQAANFLDAGGQATKDTMKKAFEIIIRDSRVQVILVNIYGGIVRCDMIAESIIAAAAEIGSFRVPVVVRLQGTNSAEGLKLIEESGLGLYTEAEFGDVARKAVELAGP